MLKHLVKILKLIRNQLIRERRRNVSVDFCSTEIDKWVAEWVKHINHTLWCKFEGLRN